MFQVRFGLRARQFGRSVSLAFAFRRSRWLVVSFVTVVVVDFRRLALALFRLAFTFEAALFRLRLRFVSGGFVHRQFVFVLRFQRFNFWLVFLAWASAFLSVFWLSGKRRRLFSTKRAG